MGAKVLLVDRITEQMISRAAMRILTRLKAAEDADDLYAAEVVCEGRVCYVDLDTVSKAKVYELLRLVLLRDDSEQGKGFERYSLNEEGRAMVDDPNYVPKIISFLPHNGN